MAEKNFVVIPTDGDTKMIVVQPGAEYNTLSDAVGGYIEAVALQENITLWLNEEGKLSRMPHNVYAQRLWDAVYGPGSDVLVGTAVVTGGAGEDGETNGLDFSDVQDLIALTTDLSDQERAERIRRLKWII